MRRMRPMVRVLSGLALLALAALWPTSAHAGLAPQSGDDLTLDVHVGFDGYLQPGAWTPITVTASNDGPDLTGEVRVVVNSLTGARTIYSRPIELPRTSRKTITLYANDITAFGNEVQVDLLEHGRVVMSQRVHISTVSPTTLLIGVWSDSPPGLADLALVEPSSGEVAVATLTAADLPALATGWQALDVLVIADADTGQLTPDQSAALRRWVAGGGRLVIVSGVGFQRTLSGLSDLSPVAAAGTQTISLAPLADLAGEPFAAQVEPAAPVAVGELVPGARLLAAADGLPLAASWQVGYGQVHFLAADPNLEPLRSWDGMESLWRALLLVGRPRPAWAYGFSSQWDYARQAVAAVPGVSLPSAVQLCGFLALYVALIGPVNYLVLSRLKRRELAWFTIPALIVVFSAIAYVTGFQLRGSRAILHRLSSVHSWSGSDLAKVDAIVGVWSPRRARYDIQVEPGYLTHPMPRDLGGAFSAIPDVRVEQGEAVTLRDVRVDVGSVQPFVVEGFTVDAPRVSGRLALRNEAGGLRVSGSVSNASNVSLRDVALALGGVAIPLGDLPARSVLQVDELLTGGQAARAPTSPLDPFPEAGGFGYYGGYDSFVSGVAGRGNCYAAPEAQRRCNLFLSLLNGQGYGAGLTLFGWSESAPFAMQVLNASTETVDTTLHAIELEADFVPAGQGTIEVPPGLTTWRTLDDPYGYASPYNLYIYSGQQFTFRFEPSALVPPLEVQSFTIHLDLQYGGEPLVQAHNFQTGLWDTLVLAGSGSTFVQEAGRYVDPAGGVELRVVSIKGDFSVQISRFDVTLRGAVMSP